MQLQFCWHFFGLSYVSFPSEDPYVTTLFTCTGKICVGKMNAKYYSQCNEVTTSCENLLRPCEGDLGNL